MPFAEDIQDTIEGACVIRTDELRANRLVWRFQKSGANGEHTKVIGDLREDVRERLGILAGVRPPEIAAIGRLQSDSDWLLVTSARVVWCDDHQVQEVPLSQIADATVTADDLRTAGRAERLATITLVTRAGERRSIRIEPGHALSGVWNALKMVPNWYASHEG